MLEKGIKFLHTITRPKDGVRESEIKQIYCPQCKEFTFWFIGKGKVRISRKLFITRNEIPDFDLKDLKSELRTNLENLQSIRIQLKKATSNILRRMISLNKLKSIRQKENRLVEQSAVLKIDFTQSLLNIQFYKDNNPIPRCLECGGIEQNAKPPIPIARNMDVSDNSIRINPAPLNWFVYEYDEIGNARKIELFNHLHPISASPI
ncbi:hypothetical protein [Robiginitalea biformata]|uniref:Uncharacterized protein n=1 Tax=Robiginitalea biformata (strain ATCC BAA-864 / DSM 15991 / KCTC 12146 / HTCC2501) TaxID=313596 RepID=A4CHR6_ROBBH|nr:hypothetical protein [Robiginitalea biformata]EAR16474.1 hypothetical protein RB2501_06230 [Robiginitalea biformata HTCC2501]